MAAIVLLPLVPAYILFKFLPSKGQFSGPFQKFSVKFGGAFAGYLFVFLAVIISIRPKDVNHYHTWTVMGRLRLEGADVEAPNLHDVIVRVVPPHLNLENGGLSLVGCPRSREP